MRLLQQLLTPLCFGLIAATAGAAPANPVNGVDYRTLEQAQQTDAGKKIEVTEFFSYACPHCNAFDPSLSEWVKKQGDAIVFKRVAVGFHKRWLALQRMYYALEAMGKSDELNGKIFRAVHVEHQSLYTDAEIIAFIPKLGLDKAKFAETYNSFGVQAKVDRVAQLQEAHKIDGVPTIAIDGRYVTSPEIVRASLGSNQLEPVLLAGTLQVMDDLVTKAGKEHKPQTASAKPAPAAPANNLKGK